MLHKTAYQKIAAFLLLPGMVVIGAIIFSSANNPTAHAANAADWKAGNIIDDTMFTNSSAMSVQDIQDFLDARIGVCDIWGTGIATEFGYSGTRAQFAASRGWPGPAYTCLNKYYEVPKLQPGGGTPANNYSNPNVIPAGAQSAAWIIKDAAERYDISPKVLLVKLGTESAGPLTSDNWPLFSQYKYAMGARCPDSGPGGSANCDEAYAGFSIQMYEAAKLLRWYLDNMQQPWWSYKKPFQVNSILWNVIERGCGAENVYIENKATAALYTYTPYQPNRAALNNLYGTGDYCSAYGNRNFWRVFTDWFGSTQPPQYDATPLSQSRYPTMRQGESSATFFTYKNTGNATWYDEVSAWPAGQKPVRLGTDYAPNRNSPFGSSWRFGPSRPVDTFAAVYAADGVTLTENQHVVHPGEIARFAFEFTAPLTLAPGYYQEAFRPLVEGGGAMSGPGAWLGVTVQ